MSNIPEALNKILQRLEKEGYWVKQLENEPLGTVLYSTNLCSFIVGSVTGRNIVLVAINSRVGMNIVIPLLSKGFYLARKTLLLVKDIEEEAEKMLRRLGNFTVARWEEGEEHIIRLIKIMLRET